MAINRWTMKWDFVNQVAYMLSNAVQHIFSHMLETAGDSKAGLAS